MKSLFLFQGLLLGGAYVPNAPPAAPLQTTYSQYHATAYEGMVADSRDQVVESRIVETAAGIGFGKVTVQGATDNQVRVAEVTRPFVGISIATNFLPETVLPADLYPQYSNIPILRKGPIWVTASVAVAPGDPVYYVPATGVLTNVVGANTLIVGASWRTSTTGAALAVLLLQ
jgi:hypothetical protein